MQLLNSVLLIEVVMGDDETADELKKLFVPVFTLEDTSSVPEIQVSQGLEVRLELLLLS